MRDFLLTLVIFGSIPIIFVKPHVGILVWSWISYMNLHRFTWGFAFDFRFALLVAFATIVAWLISREPKRIPWKALSRLCKRKKSTSKLSTNRASNGVNGMISRRQTGKRRLPRFALLRTGHLPPETD